MPTILLHQWEMSPFCNKTRRCLRRKGLTFSEREYNGLAALDAAKLSKVGTLPVLDYDDERVVDSTAIAEFLDRKHPENPLYPHDPEALAMARFWEDWAAQSLYFYEIYLRMLDPEAMEKAVDLLTRGRPSYERPIMKMVIKRRYPKKLKAQGLGRLDRAEVERQLFQHVDGLDKLLTKRSWLAGDALSIADISVAAQLDEMVRTSSVAPRILDHANVRAWLERTVTA